MSAISYEHIGVQYEVESSYGTTVGTQGVWIGIIQDARPALEMNRLKLRGIGGVDLNNIAAGLKSPDITIRYVPQKAGGGFDPVTFLEYVRTAPTGLSVEYLATLSGPTYVSLNHKGCLIDSLEVDIPEEQYTIITVKLVGQDVTIGTTRAFSAYASDPATAPLSWFDTDAQIDVNGGYSSLSICGRVKFHVKNNYQRTPVIRATNADLLKYILRRQRDLGGELTCYFEDKTYLEDVYDSTDFKLKFFLEKAGDTPYVEFTGCYWDRSEVSTRIMDVPCKINLPFTAKAVSAVA